jgi:hypothetical protein
MHRCSTLQKEAVCLTLYMCVPAPDRQLAGAAVGTVAAPSQPKGDLPLVSVDLDGGLGQDSLGADAGLEAVRRITGGAAGATQTPTATAPPASAGRTWAYPLSLLPSTHAPWCAAFMR